ncbi:saccharopine dehydrogenase NADP-binding domain-containing protein [Pararhizobium sp. YC-54]|uniref:saccharopine dehydrogenase family protein n=1 Tax=Pararhizobium sp. YC-54 TaxID=2986920 RepID=UPI0021F77675|nr:saccharopine dehydrogenase NADP-binding domain-containing protein [Pararhizobium sp. YC-54]MCV9998184.1 saccharopine dehydrogenase NADP-binding domain-containing protein [Pararhizobium sp. YC-54]
MLDHSGNTQGQKVAVFGAAGHTGRFVVAELLRRGFDVIAIGRDKERLANLAEGNGSVEARLAAVEDPSSLDRALEGAAVVINCAGPFLDTAEPVISAALRARIAYLDMSAEQPAVLSIFERFAEPAKAAGIAIVPAMGFYGGLGDLLATAAIGDWTSVDDLRIAIALDSWLPTQGTRRTGERNTAHRLVIGDGQLQPLPSPAPTTSWRFASPFDSQDMIELPFSETILISRHLKVGAFHNYLNLTPLRDLRDVNTPPPEAADETGRSAQVFLMEVVAQRKGEVRRTCVTGRDIYAVTAPLIVEAVQRLLRDPIEKGGVFAPGQLFDAGQFLQSLAPRHLAYKPAIPV